MQERNGIGKLTRQAREILVRLISGVKVGTVFPVCPSMPHAISPQSNTVLNELVFGIPVNQSGCELGFSIKEKISRIPTLMVEAQTIIVSMDPSVVNTPCYDQAELTVQSESCELKAVYRDAPFDLDLDASCMVLDFNPFDCEMSKLGESCFKVTATPGKCFEQIEYSQKRGITYISHQPMSIGPIPWNRMEKEFIIESWDFLRLRAKLELGYDPGRDLLMRAIFKPVDFSVAHGLKYDPALNRLFMHIWPQNGQKRLKKRLYAVIIGIVRGTRQVLQVPVSLDRY